MRAPRRSGLQAAFDEARFGAGRTLNLRASLPTAAEATRRAEAWLRERQIARAGEVLIITGRGNRSEGRVPVVREAVRTLLAALARRGVVAGVQEHTPGSFVVRLAPVRALYETRAQRGGAPASDAAPPPAPDPATLAGLSATTRARLRHLATLALEALGAGTATEHFVQEEMARQFAALSASLASAEGDAETLLGRAIERAITAFEEA